MASISSAVRMLSLCCRFSAATPFGYGAICWGPLLVGGVSADCCGVALLECWNPFTEVKEADGVGALTAVNPPALTGVKPPVLVGAGGREMGVWG